ncbi:hypothetical protein [[Mycoplasma] collis]|uniref:hypothetical protein n=1 Tax=[Mycoplasma] collis TaxID=2127 RepID=UPI00051C722E|nr:hypothetical protein [[Mycoplasma] collis]
MNLKVSRFNKWKKYREAIYGLSFFYSSFLNKDKAKKNNLELLTKNINDFNYEKIINSEEIINDFQKSLTINKIHLEKWKIPDLKNKIQKLNKEFEKNFSFFEEIEFNFDFFIKEKERINKIKIQKYEKEKNEKN